MASGSKSLTITSWDTLKFSWWENSQSIANNSTVVGWKMELVAGSSGRISSTVSKVWAVTVNGTQYEGSNTVGISNNSTKTLASGTTTIYHGSDGTKTFSYSFAQQFGITFSGTYIGTKSSSGSGTLTTIPREAKITAAPNFNDEGNPTITYSNPAGNSVTSLQACISLDGSSADIAYRNISKTGTSYTFSLTEAERNVLRNATTGSNSRTVRFYVQTVIGGNTYRNYLSKTFTIINGSPTLSPSVYDGGSSSMKLTGDPENTIIKYYNWMLVSNGESARKGATIVSRSISCGGKSINTSSGTLTYVEDPTFKFSVTDNRGNTTTQHVTVRNFIPYIRPTCRMRLNAPSTNGTMYFKIEGAFYNGSLGAVQNNIVVQYRYKKNGEDYPADWVTVTPTIGDNYYYVDVNLDQLNYEDAYTFQSRVTDEVGKEDPGFVVYTPERVVKTMPIFDWGRDDFRVNGLLSVRRGSSSDDTSVHQIGLGRANSGDDWRFYVHSNGDFSIDAADPNTGAWLNKVLTFSKTDTLSDFVIEHGEDTATSGDGVQATWVYKKWKSGTVEAWCYAEHEYTLDSTGQFAFDVSYPFAIYNSIPLVQGSKECWRCHKPIWVTNNDNSARLYLYIDSVPDNVHTSPFGVHIHVHGRWKQ